MPSSMSQLLNVYVVNYRKNKMILLLKSQHDLYTFPGKYIHQNVTTKLTIPSPLVKASLGTTSWPRRIREA